MLQQQLEADVGSSVAIRSPSSSIMPLSQIIIDQPESGVGGTAHRMSLGAGPADEIGPVLDDLDAMAEMGDQVSAGKDGEKKMGEGRGRTNQTIE